MSSADIKMGINMLTDSQNTSDFFLDDSMLNMSSISAGISNDFQSVLDSTEFSGDLNTSNMQNNQVMQLLVQELKSGKAKQSTLQNDKSKLKNLLRKAKTAIDALNSKLKNSQDSHRTLEHMLHLTEKQRNDFGAELEKLKKRRSGIDKSQVRQLLARVKVNEIGYTLVQD